MHDDFYQMYLEELKMVEPCSEQEQERLLNDMDKAGTAAKNRLIEGNLHRALNYAKGYADKGIPMADLVQEANMALTAAVNAWKGEPFLSYIEEEIKKSLNEALESWADEKKVGEELAARANVLQEVSNIMARELGREATEQELAERMKMSVDEIKEIMKITIDALSIHTDAGEMS